MYYGQKIDGKPVDQKILEVFPQLNKSDGFFIECGACDGIVDSSCLFFEKLGWKGINIEPFKEMFDRLVKNRSGLINLNVALSDYNGKANFASTLNTFIGCGSIDGPNDYLINQLRGNKHIIYSTVETITYKNLIEKQNVKVVDLFVLDVEGHEIKVINGMKDCDVLPEAFVIEYGHVGFKDLNDVVIGLRYKLMDKDSVNCFYQKA